MGFEVWDLGFGVWCSEFGFPFSGSGVQVAGIRFGSIVSGFGFRVYCLPALDCPRVSAFGLANLGFKFRGSGTETCVELAG